MRTGAQGASTFCSLAYNTDARQYGAASGAGRDDPVGVGIASLLYALGRHRYSDPDSRDTGPEQGVGVSKETLSASGEREVKSCLGCVMDGRDHSCGYIGVYWPKTEGLATRR